MHSVTGSSVNYKYRMHDTRIGRFLSIDPLAPDYPHNSPYAFSENRVIDGFELEGLEHVNNKYWVTVAAEGKPVIELFDSRDVPDPGTLGWGAHMRFFDKSSGREIAEMQTFTPTEAPLVYAKPGGSLYVLGSKVGSSSDEFSGVDGFNNGGAQIIAGVFGAVLGGASIYSGGLNLIGGLGMGTAIDDISAGTGRGTLLENLLGKDAADGTKVVVDAISLSAGLRSLIKTAIDKGSKYDNFLIDLSNVVDDEVNAIKGLEEEITDEN